MDTLRQFHSGMVHAIADLALFFYGYMRRVLAIVIGRKMHVLYLVMLVCIYHILPRYKAEQECPGADDMIDAFFHNKQYAFGKFLQK